jgi:ATP phosphoribosyltransferase regulatory subunit HisZ
MANRSRYPAGAHPLLIEQTARRRGLEQRIVCCLEQAGFAEVVVPIIDYAEMYAGAGMTRRADGYRFVDREGELIAIRSDFTPMVARALAPTMRDTDLPLRVFYRGDVIRCGPSRLGVNREMFQIGAEIAGDASATADIEILRLAADVVRALGRSPLVIYNDTLNRADDIRSALAGDDTFVHLDDAETDAGYYTGIRLWVHDATTRRLIARGGRYDSLYGQFGTPAPAVGLTFTVDDLD